MHKHTLIFMDFYIALPGKKKAGPFKKEELLANGLKPNSLVWSNGMPTWKAAKLVDELSDLFVATPPTAQASAATPPPLPQAAPAPTPPPMPDTITLQRELHDTKKEIDELKTLLEQKESEADKKLVAAREKRKSEIKEKKKQKEKEEKKKTSKNKKKTKYDYPVADWRNEAIWLLVFVISHALMALFGWTTFFYIYLDIVGAILSIAGIVIGQKIKSLNKISLEKDSESRLKAEKLSKFNGFLVSATAAAGFLIILVQSAYYVYIC